MNELLRLLRSVREGLSALLGINEELLALLDEEERLISAYELGGYDRIVIEKDALVQRATLIEERRVNQMQRICFLMAYDARGKTPGLEEFRMVFDVYLKNVEGLVDSATLSELRSEFSEIREVAGRLREIYGALHPRIYRNKKILEKTARNIARSLEVMSNEVDTTVRYNAKGKTTGVLSTPGSTSSLRVRA